MTAAAKNFNQLLTQTPSDFQRMEMAGRPTLDLPGFAGNPVAGYGVTDTWGTGYGVAGVSRRRRVAGDWIAVYVENFGKYAYVLYVFTNKHIYFS
jgi:hypothetical protein